MPVGWTVANAELLQIADSVARDKGIARESILEAMQQAIQVAGRRKYGHDFDIRAEIDKKSGNINLFRVTTVVEEVEDQAKQISLKEAKRKDLNAEIGDELKDMLPPIDFGRIAAQTAKQVIIQKVRDAERDKQFDEFKDKAGEIVSGTVKRVEYGNTTVDLGGKAEAVLRKDESIPRENFRQGDRIRAYLLDVRREKGGPQLFLSRSHPNFLAKLFAQEVPEIYDGIIEIKGVARDPGSRAKISVSSRDSSIDPVGSCVGVRGSRVQAVTNELQGEKIDIIPWSQDPAALVVNALAPASVTKVVIDENKRSLEVVVPDEQLSIAIGRRGQNVRLASQLVGWDIDVMTEDESSKRRNDEYKKLSEMFIEALDVEEVIAQLLVAEGFTTIEDVALVPLEDITSIEGFDEAVATELQSRANAFINAKAKEFDDKVASFKISDDLINFEPLNKELVLKLAEKGIKTLDDFADLARDEFVEMVPDSGLSNRQIDDAIMAARAHWFNDNEDDDSAEA